MTVFIVGHQQPYSLEASYQRAFEAIGVRVRTYAIFEQQEQYVRLGALGRLFHTFVPVDTWQRKLNRELALTIVAEQPDMVLVFCNAPVLAGTLAFVRTLTTIPFVLVWPDPLLNLLPHLYPTAPLYDGVATYCKASISVFEQLGFRNVQWVPLAADETLHNIAQPPTEFDQDLLFIGALRPEREETLATILHLFPSLRLSIWGTDWHRCRHAALRKLAHKKPLTGKDYALALQRSRISLNVIDATCLPAANMRFFEIPMAYGLQLASACPEFDQEYRHQTHLLYYDTTEALADSINWALSHPAQTQELREAAHLLTLKRHTYQHRAAQLLKFCRPQRTNTLPILQPK